MRSRQGKHGDNHQIVSGGGTLHETAINLGVRIRQPQPIADRQFEIEFLDPGVEAFAFTFD
jgi:hypothetical protein